MKNNMDSNKKWLVIAEKYFDATATEEEERSLALFLTTKESNSPEFDEIKAVMGFLAVARKSEKKNRQQSYNRKSSFAIRWSAVAATIAIIAGIGITHNALDTEKTESEDRYIANINGKIYTDKEFVLNHMHRTMASIGTTTKKNSIEEQLGAMFSIADR